MSFTHFEPSLFQFLRELQKNNDRIWFKANQARYKRDVEEPILSFIATLSSRLPEISPHFIAEPKAVGGSMFRIYRDTRFSKDKTPYKGFSACRFTHGIVRSVHEPCLTVHLEPDAVHLGGGTWMPQSDALYAIRMRIQEKPEEWEAVLKDKAFKNMFGAPQGETLQRPPRGFDLDAKYLDAIKLKSFFAIRYENEEFALNKNWMSDVMETYAATTPLLKFICKALQRPF